MREGAADCRPFALPSHIVFAEPHEHGGDLSTGGVALRVEVAAVALDDARAAGPLHGGDGVLADLQGVGVA